MSICITLDTEQGRIAVNLANGQALVYAPDSVIELGDGVAWAPTPPVGLAFAGVGATAGVGSLAPVFSLALMGNAATGAAGAVGVTLAAALVSASATAAVQSPGVTLDTALTGAAGTASLGALTPNFNIAATGSAGTGAAGSLQADVFIGLSGAQATGATELAKAPDNVGVLLNVDGADVLAWGAGLTRGLGGADNTIILGEVDGYTLAWAPSPITYVLGLIEVPIAGAGATGAVDVVQPGLSAGLTGNPATGAIDALGASASVALAGSPATGTVGLPGAGLGLTGSAATGEVGALGSAAIKTGVVIWGRFPASRSVGKTATQGTMKFRRAA